MSYELWVYIKHLTDHRVATFIESVLIIKWILKFPLYLLTSVFYLSVYLLSFCLKVLQVAPLSMLFFFPGLDIFLGTNVDYFWVIWLFL